MFVVIDCSSENKKTIVNNKILFLIYTRVKECINIDLVPPTNIHINIMCEDGEDGEDGRGVQMHHRRNFGRRTILNKFRQCMA